MNSFVLLVNWYDAKTELRKRENEYALFKNLQLPQINSFVFWDSCKDEEYLKDLTANSSKNITINREVIDPPEYKHFLNYAKESNNKNKHFIIANTDIYFDKTLEAAEELLNNDPDLVLALSRYEPNQDKQGHTLYHNAEQSQDSWFFSPETLKRLNPSKYNFSLGKYGCDNRIAKILSTEGFTVKNYCINILTYHVHSSNQRFRSRDVESDKVPGPYLALPPLKALS